MKKLSALALLLALCLTLTACSQERYPELADRLDAGDYEGAILAVYELYQQYNTTEPEATTDPEVLRRYETLTNAITSLTHYVENGYDLHSFCFSHYDGHAHKVYQGMDAVQWLYETALSLGEYEDAAAIASRFTKLENVALGKTYTYEDALGNPTADSSIFYVYGADGSLISQSDDRFLVSDHFGRNYGIPEYTYDENGKLMTLRYRSGEVINCLLEYTYNADGTTATTHYLDRDGFEFHITHSYANGLLIQSTGLPYAEYSKDTMTVTYHYDENGRLVREEGIKDSTDRTLVNLCVKTVDYTYDEQGRLSSVRKASEYHEKQNFEDQDYTLRHFEDVRLWTMEYNEADQLVRNFYSFIGNVDLDGTPQNPDYRTYVGETTYGTYYVYTPES